MPSNKQDKEFSELMGEDATAEVIISTLSLDRAIDYISDNLNPDDVFKIKDLESWAESNGYIKE